MRLTCAKTGKKATGLRPEDRVCGMSGLGEEAGVSSDKVGRPLVKDLNFILSASLCPLPKWP